jgi:serine/threonine protein kinase
VTDSLAPMDEPLLAGDLLRARYEIQRLVRSIDGKNIYLAQDLALDCQVIVDVFSHNPIMPSGLAESAWETRVLAELGDHPNITTILDYWEDDETGVMVTKYLSGGSLRDLIERSHESGETLPVERILRISTEIATGLVHIHRHHILYRDLQPRNLLFDERGTIHLVDFDTAVPLDECQVGDPLYGPVFSYVAPELINADERADLYSLGVTIFEMCQGRPFAGSREEILTVHRAHPSQSVGRHDLPESLRDLVFNLLAPHPEQRPASAAEVVRRLDGIRVAWADLDSNVEGDALSTLATLLNMDLITLTKSPTHGDQFRLAFRSVSPETDLSPDHRFLMLAVIALAETDYRQAVIDAGTATEIALASTISDKLRAKGLNDKYIHLTTRRANGLAGLLALYATFEDTWPMSQGKVKELLANIRNSAAHIGRIPSAEEAIGAVEIARTLVITLHPLDGGT